MDNSKAIMKRYKYILFTLVVTIFGCQSEIDVNDMGDNTNENFVPMSFYAGIEIPQDSSLTKTILDGTSSDALRNLLWEYQDEVYVTNGSQSSKFTNVSQGTSAMALLEGNLGEGADYFAAYPYDIVTGYSLDGFSIKLPATQEYYKDGISSDSFPMVAQCQDGVFNFKNLCGVFVLRLTGEETISSVTFSAKDASGKGIPVAGNGVVSMDYSENPTLLMEDTAGTSVMLKSSDGVLLSPSKSTTFHIVLPVGTYDTFTITIRATDGSEMVINSNKSIKIKRSNRTTAASLTYFGSTHDFKDLNGSGETANCYIVSEPGYYKFKTLKGNSSETVGNVCIAEVLWETYGTDISPVVGDLIQNVSYFDGYIRFSTSSHFKEGNAVIAAKDAMGTILWSWHIWLTDLPEEQEYYRYSYKPELILMDRNLGAVSVTPGDVGGLGLLYQWGRKDPFIGSSSISANVEAKSTAIWPSPVKSSSSTGTIEYATENPMTFILRNYSNYSWLHPDSPDEYRLWEVTKTKYDPCPSGWRIPYVWVSPPELYEWPFDNFNKGMNFSGKFGEASIWYPAAGCRSSEGGDLFDVGVDGHYWGLYSSHESSSSAFEISDLGFYYKDSNTYYFEARGYSVRCIKE